MGEDLICRGKSQNIDESVGYLDRWLTNLQGIGEGLVELGDLGRHAQVDGAVTDLNDQTADQLGVDLGDDLELLALAVLGLGDGLFEAGDGLVVEFLRGLLVYWFLWFLCGLV